MANTAVGEKTIISTIDCIKSSTLFSNKRYEWIVQLISDVLSDNLQEANINSLIDTLLEKKKKESCQSNNQMPIVASTSDTNKSDTIFSSIKKLVSIDKITNVGLLEITEPLIFKDGLNVFYGKNGAGKSTLYTSLCKTLGKNRKLFANVNNSVDKSYCSLNVENENGDKLKIEWRSDQEQKQSYKVKIFDSLISNYIVQQDQVNRFEIAHLKMEYFARLYDLYDILEAKIESEKDKLENEKQTLDELLLNTVPSIFENGFQLDSGIINELTFEANEEKQLKTLDGKIEKLKQTNTSSTLKNLVTVREIIEGVLLEFGAEESKASYDNEPINEWELTYTNKYFDEINEKIENFYKVKKAFEESGKNKIASLVPNEWISNATWERFINSSVDFLNSLGNDNKTYKIDKCVYCQQPLKTKESKALIKAYQELYKEHEEKLLSISGEVDQISQDIKRITEILDKINQNNDKIVAEFINLNKDENSIVFDFSKLKDFFKEIESNLTKKQKIVYSDENLQLVNSFWNIYKKLYNDFNSEINSLNKLIENKEKSLEELDSAVKPLRYKKLLFQEKNNILKYINKIRLITLLDIKLDDISSLKQLTSSLKTSFTQEAPLKEFKKHLEKEYQYLKFVSPQNWNIKPVTREGVNKRVYSIGDRKLSEIFSEGEQKIHALSDFFAQCALDSYKGVYIFDDPVNSLDDVNIECVAKRILKLLEEGNQVIIFTHNLYFLNSIIDTQKDKITKLECLENQIVLIKEIGFGEKEELKDKLGKIESKLKGLSASNTDEFDLRNTYDLISGYLEDYVEKIYFKNVISRYRPNIRMHTLGDLKNLNTNIISELLTLYEKASRRCSRHSQPSDVIKPTYSELVKDVLELTQKYKYTN